MDKRKKHRAPNGHGGGNGGKKPNLRAAIETGKVPKNGKSRNVPIRPGPGRGGKRAGAGGPPKNFSYDPASQEGMREAARAQGHAQLANCIELWSMLVETGIRFMRGELQVGQRRRGKSAFFHIPDEYAGPILRASENLANRCGLPVLSETSVRGSVPVKLINEGQGPGWKDDAGVFHPITPEGAPTPEPVKPETEGE